MTDNAATDRSSMKLGKQPYREDRRTLRFASYVDPKVMPPAPASCKWDRDVKTWPMYANDRIGDCTCAEVGHHLQLWTAAAGHEIDVTEADVVGLYEKVSGYDPATGANDNGAVILDVLNRWRHDGIAGHKIGAFAEVDVHNHALVEDAIWLFGGISIGVALPVAAQHQANYWHLPRGGTGTPAGRPGSWGGHCVYSLDYDRRGITVVSWGELIRMSWAFWDAYCEEAWAVISTDFLNGAQQTPQGFNVAQLQADLAQIGKVQ